MINEGTVTQVIRLREMRNQHGLSQIDLSERSGVAQSVISDIETGVTKSPRIGIVMKLAKALNCKAEDLYEPEIKHA